MDPTVSQGEPINVAIGSYLPKIVVTIPFIGYLMAATKSIEGLIVLGLVVLFLIILYVIAELWKKDPDDDYDDYPDDTEPGICEEPQGTEAGRKTQRTRVPS